MRPSRLSNAVLAACVALSVTGCAYRSPGPGQVAVLVDYPWIWGQGGVRSDVLTTGSGLYWSSTNAVYVNVVPIAFQQTLDDMNSKDGVPLDFNAQLTGRITDPVRMVKEFGTDMNVIYRQNIAKEFESLARRAVRNHAEADIAVSAIEAIDADVEKGMRAHFTAIKIPFELREITVGKANPPDKIEAQRIDTAAQRQRKITETERNAAEIARRAAEDSRATADRAYNDRMGISETQNVDLAKTKMIADACAKSTCTFLMGAGVTPLLQVR